MNNPTRHLLFISNFEQDLYDMRTKIGIRLDLIDESRKEGYEVSDAHISIANEIYEHIQAAERLANELWRSTRQKED